MKKKFRLLLLLALLMTAATGAWGMQIYISYPSWPTGTNVNGDGNLVLEMEASDSFENMKAKIEDKSGLNPDYMKLYFNSVEMANNETLNAKGVTSNSVLTLVYTLYTVSMKSGVKDADKWTAKVGEGQAQALPIGGLKGDGSETVTLQYNGRLKVKGVKATSDAGAPTGNIVDLSTLTADYVAQNGDVLTGETTSYEVTIAAGATVTLDGVTISGSSCCIKCAGDATIILKDGTTNTLTSSSQDYPALSIGDANTTLTIQGSTGVLNVTSGDYCAGIGGGYKNTNSTCGNIRIEGGVITAQGGNAGAGIGTDCGHAICGDIIITGGTITAKGGSDAAGIGTGSGISQQVVCGDITIANTVTKVTATKGGNAPHSIGKGYGDATCGTVTIGGTKYWENNAAVNGGDTYLATSPLIYDPSAPAATLQSITVGKGSTDLSSDKIFYYMPGDTYRQALARTENQTAGDLGWGCWEGYDITTVYFKEVSTKAWDMAIDGDNNFGSGQGSSTITLDSVIDTTNHTFQFVNSQ